MYKIVLTKEAVKFYKKADKKTKKLLNQCFEDLKNSPLCGANIKKLNGELDGFLRYRVGSLRVIYNIEESKITVVVVAIGSRGDVYK
jgi:mRNA interferase RelE/StbE